eukprot:TRINITY_DN3103_c3_g1_i1.p1 TRINITY_DN3103_c3_g1~~TRINITY_DN3103_c3_g1_i1.p1  ORF type:complete len:694 (-),score=100.68 TRINITY_DN3103_c3_g1_i1:62-2143(-)
MPREVQGGGRSASSNEVGALPFQCGGEKGRDYLRRYIQDDSPFTRAILKALDEDGYTVLREVLSAPEADSQLDRAWSFVTKVSPTIRRNDWNTWWANCGGPDPWPHAQRDMMQLHQAGWVFSDLRELIAERVFEPLYGTRELHVSKDGFTFQRPTSSDMNLKPNDHYDQGSRWFGLQCIQGSVALTDQTENDGCFSVWPGSHRYHEEIVLANHRASIGDFVMLNDSEKMVLRNNGLAQRRIRVQRGDMILWRSDVVHCGAPPLGKCDTCRVVAYVCCLPAELTPEAVYAQKIRAYERLESGSHWPNREEWFGMAARHRRMSWSRFFVKPPQLTRRQRELYGLERYDSAGDVKLVAALSHVETSTPSAASAAAEVASAIVATVVRGITCAMVAPATVRAALIEIRPFFSPSTSCAFSKEKLGGMPSSMFEVCYSFHDLERHGEMRIARSMDKMPCLRALLVEAMLALRDTDAAMGFCASRATASACSSSHDDVGVGSPNNSFDLREDTLNVICRRYTKGQGLATHRDRPSLFCEDVCGCVLLNTSDSVLTFEQSDRDGKLTAGPHRIDEEPGCCFRQRGPARYEWTHGVPPLDCGERISVTWRWIKQPADSGRHRQNRARDATASPAAAAVSASAPAATSARASAAQVHLQDGFSADHKAGASDCGGGYSTMGACDATVRRKQSRWNRGGQRCT